MPLTNRRGLDDFWWRVLKTTSILVERLRAWKHMCGYLENYVSTTQKVQKAQAKEFEKILKTVSQPLKEGHHFVQGKGGVTGLFDTLRLNTQGIADVHLETEKNLKSTVLPILEKLHSEIKHKSKELKNGASRAEKQVARARTATQKHIELLGQYTAAFDSAAKPKHEASNDPYIISRGVTHRLNRQVTEENNNLRELLAIQTSFQQFEAHILESVQTALNRFFQCMGAQSDRQRAMYADMVSSGQQIPADFEWMNFYERNDASLINPNTPQRSMSNISFPNQDHRATKPMVEGTLQRKSRTLMKGYNEGYYVVTPAGFLHGFKDNDDFHHDPQPDISLYLPDCTIGNFDDLKFSIKGKDVSSGKVGNAFHMSSELHFKAHSKNQIDEWAAALTSFVGPSSAGVSGGSQPSSPTVQRTSSIAQSPTSAESPVMQPLPENKPVDAKTDPVAASAAPTAPTAPATSTEPTAVSGPAGNQEAGVVAVAGTEKAA
ncbi:hypothetical protein PRK78_003655 [Emydomyces testavorans]|uniref:PH domain-containing protein n=1 Tax=Emydomyces testavorans TaxID=2070801 RepID=A0AAF0DGL2_9EURO|nr:hypothetical protein PRK78_003655 [Emydomyces testavorans]